MLGIRELMNRALFTMCGEECTVGSALAGAAATVFLAALGAAVIYVVCLFAAI